MKYRLLLLTITAILSSYVSLSQPFNEREERFIPCISNSGFEYWEGSMPYAWSKANDVIGSITRNVLVEEGKNFLYDGNRSIKVSTVSPCGGIQQPVGPSTNLSFMIYPKKGRGAVHLAKSDGTSAFFSKSEIFQDNFTVCTTGEPSTAIRCIHAQRIENGDLIELFSASSYSEKTNKGGVYLKRNSSEPILFMHDSGYKIWPWAGVADLYSKYIWVSMRLRETGEIGIYATDVSRNFDSTRNDRILYFKEGYNMQAYNMVKLESGRYVIPIVYAKVDEVSKGPWMLDILFTDDNFETVTCLDSPRTLGGRGLMEPHPVILSSGKVAILCRTSLGYLAKAIYNPSSNILGEANLTEIAQPESGSFARNLNNGDILLSWVGSINTRKLVVMAISPDDMENWKSFHVLASSEAVGDPMDEASPYVHQPYLFQDGSRLVAYFERVESPTIISLYKCEGINYDIDNVSSSLNNWQNLTCNYLPQSTSNIQLLNVINRDSEVYYDNVSVAPVPLAIVGPESICSSTTASFQVNGQGEYDWLIPADWKIKEGQGTNSVILEVGQSAGDILAIPKNTCDEGLIVASSVSINPIVGIPQAPTGDQAVDMYHDIRTTYTIPKVTGAESYSWSLKPEGIGTLEVNDTSVIINWLQTGTAQLMASAQGTCNTTFGKSLTIEVANTVQVTDVNPMLVTVFPNPVQDKLLINFEESHANVDISIFDMKGYQVKSTQAKYQDAISIDVGNMSPGAYILKVVYENSIIVRKILKV